MGENLTPILDKAILLTATVSLSNYFLHFLHRVIKKKGKTTLKIITPIIGFALLFLWFSTHAVAQGPSINASFSNPIGFLASNFVYDGMINLENIALSCAFLLANLFLFYSDFLRMRSAALFPVVAVASGATTQLAGVIACGGECSFYGMSGVAGGSIGFTCANFALVFGLLFHAKHKGKRSRTNDNNSAGDLSDVKLVKKQTMHTISLPILLFVAYLLLLLLFSGFFAIHPTSTHNPFPISVQIPVSIASESQPIQVGHTTGVAVGFLLALILLFSFNYGREPLSS